MRKSLVAAIAASAALSGCQAHRDEDGGANVSRTYHVGNFHQIEVAGPYDVNVRTGSNPGVSGTGPEKLLGRTIVEVRGDKLLIRPEEHRGWFNFGWSRHGKASFTVTVPQLSGAEIAGSGDIHVDRVQGERFEGGVAGSGSIALGNVEVQALKLSIAGSGGIKAGAGKAQSAEYEIAGSGDVDAGAVQAQQAKVSIAGSGGVHARASGTADISIMGSGDVDLTGGAKCTVSKAGSGNVHCS
jgi:hypothetical protein